MKITKQELKQIIREELGKEPGFFGKLGQSVMGTRGMNKAFNANYKEMQKQITKLESLVSAGTPEAYQEAGELISTLESRESPLSPYHYNLDALGSKQTDFINKMTDRLQSVSEDYDDLGASLRRKKLEEVRRVVRQEIKNFKR